MKRIVSILTAALSLTLCAVDPGLLKFMPENYEAMALIDVSRVLSLPDVKTAIADPQFADQLAVLEQVGLKLSDFKALAISTCDDWGAGIFRITSGENLRKALDKSITVDIPDSGDISVAAMQVNGRRIYRFNQEGRNEAVACTFIADDLVLCSDPEGLEKFFAARMLSEDAIGKLAVPSEVTLWGIWRNTEPPPAENGDNGRAEKVIVTLNFSGDAMRDIDAAAAIECDSEKFASMLGMMIPGYLSIGSGVVFADNPKLGEQFIKAFKSNVDGKTLTVSLHLSEELSKHLAEFSTRMAKDQMAAVQDTAPATTGTVPDSGK